MEFKLKELTGKIIEGTIFGIKRVVN